MGIKLWNHQQYALDKYKDKPFFGLLFSCGLGKTITALSIAKEKERPLLVIAPNTLCKQWEEDIKANFPEWSVLTCTSKTKKTKKFKDDFVKLCFEE